MSGFCTRCGSYLREDGTCPNCDAAFTVNGIFDEPQVEPAPSSSSSSSSSSSTTYEEETPDMAETVYDEPETAGTYAYSAGYESDGGSASPDYGNDAQVCP